MVRFGSRGPGRFRGSRPSYDRGYRGFGGDEPKPVKVGEEYDVEIKEVGSRGDGIARIKNFVVFVPNTKEGEKCRIKITEVRNRFAVGEKVGEAKAEVSTEVEAEVAEELEEPTEMEADEEATGFEEDEEPEESEDLEEEEA